MIDRAGMKRCQVARGKPTDDIKVCVWHVNDKVKKVKVNGKH